MQPARDREQPRSAETAASRREPRQLDAEFSAPALLAVMGIASLALALAFYFLVNEHERRPDAPVRPAMSERSALGFRALADLMVALDIPVRPMSMINGADERGRSVVLVPEVARPEIVESMRSRFDDARAIVLILQKRIPTEQRERMKGGPPIELIPIDQVRNVLSRIDPSATLERPPEPVAGWRTADTGVAPTLSSPQLIGSGAIEPLIGVKEGALIARAIDDTGTGRAAVYVVGDPDPFMNHGLDDGKNAELAIAFVKKLLGEDGILVIGEGAAGSLGPQSFWLEMFRFPLLVITLGLAAVFALICLSAWSRFGGFAVERSALTPGRRTILDSSVALIGNGGQPGAVLKHYWLDKQRIVGRRFKASRLADAESLARFIAPIEAERRVSITSSQIGEACNRLRRSNDPVEAVALARRIHQWQREMEGGK